VSLEPGEKKVIAKEGNYFITVDFSHWGTKSEVRINEIDTEYRLARGYAPLDSLISLRSIVNSTIVEKGSEKVIIHLGNRNVNLVFPFEPKIAPINYRVFPSNGFAEMKKKTHMMAGKTEYKFSREVEPRVFRETKVYLNDKNPAAELPDKSLIVLTQVIEKNADETPRWFVEGYLNNGTVNFRDYFYFETNERRTIEDKFNEKEYTIRMELKRLILFPEVPAEIIVSSRPIYLDPENQFGGQTWIE